MALGLDVQQLITHYSGFALSGIRGMFKYHAMASTDINCSGLNMNREVKLKNLKEFCVSKILAGLREYSLGLGIHLFKYYVIR
jgi:hypothetical protein